MKITKRLLRKIIREEYNRIVFERAELIKEARHLFREGDGDLSQYSLEELEAAMAATSCPNAKASIEDEILHRSSTDGYQQSKGLHSPSQTEPAPQGLEYY